MQIKQRNIVNKQLQRLVMNLKVPEVELVSSTDTTKGRYVLYKVGNILVITIHDVVYAEWDEEFEPIYFKHFDTQTSRK